MSKVSVIIPVYNQEPYLAECLDSVLAQTLREIEVICVDDGSTDGSSAILAEYAARDGRVKVIRQENAGAGPARNRGLDEATGEFIAFMDPDDRYPDDKAIEDLYAGAVGKDMSVCCGSMEAMNGEALEPEFSFDKDELLRYGDYQFEFGYVRAIFRRSLLDAEGIRFPDLRRFQDVPFFVEAMHAAGSFYALKRPTYSLRLGHHGIDWTANGCRKALDNVRGLVMVRDLAREYGYSAMADRILRRQLDFTEYLGGRVNFLQHHLDEACCELAAIKSSESFRLGLFLAAPLRKIKRVLKGAK